MRPPVQVLALKDQLLPSVSAASEASARPIAQMALDLQVGSSQTKTFREHINCLTCGGKLGLIFSDLGSFAHTLIIALPAAGGQRSAGDSTATTRGLRSTRDQEPTTAAGNAGRPWHLGQGEGGI